MAARRTVRGDVWTDKGTVWTVDVDLGRVVRQLWARHDVRDLLRNVESGVSAGRGQAHDACAESEGPQMARCSNVAVDRLASVAAPGDVRSRQHLQGRHTNELSSDEASQGEVGR